MLMNENSELRSFVSCSKNFSKNIINKSIKNNIVPINNDGGVKSKRKHRGFIPSTFGVTLSHIKFSIHISFSILFLIVTCVLFLIVIYFLICSLICIFSYTLFLVVDYSFSYIFSRIVIYAPPYYSFIKISDISLINISFSSSFISFIYISFISFIISSIFTSFAGLFISDNTIITI